MTAMINYHQRQRLQYQIRITSVGELQPRGGCRLLRSAYRGDRTDIRSQYVFEQAAGRSWLINAMGYEACFRAKAARDRT